MPAESYDTLASVYDWVVPEALLTPAGSADAFLPYLEGVAAGARVLDCAAGPGVLAVGLAQRSFDVTATDASPGMVARIHVLAEQEGVALTARACPWEDLAAQGFRDDLVDECHSGAEARSGVDRHRIRVRHRHQSISFVRRAVATAWVRVVAPSRLRACAACTRTVSGATPTRAEISR